MFNNEKYETYSMIMQKVFDESNKIYITDAQNNDIKDSFVHYKIVFACSLLSDCICEWYDHSIKLEPTLDVFVWFGGTLTIILEYVTKCVTHYINGVETLKYEHSKNIIENLFKNTN